VDFSEIKMLIDVNNFSPPENKIREKTLDINILAKNISAV